MNRIEVLAVLASGTFADLVGALENETFDAKRQPYDFGKPKGNRELARDVSAFANAEGGVIVIGLETEPSKLHRGDEVVKIHQLAEGLVDPQQYMNIIDTWCFPAAAQLSVTFHPSQADASRGLVSIDVPPQAVDAGPFLITRTVEQDKIVDTVFGYVERRRDGNVSRDVREMHQALRLGMSYDRNVAERFNRFEGLLVSLATPQPTPQREDDDLGERIERALRGGTDE